MARKPSLSIPGFPPSPSRPAEGLLDVASRSALTWLLADFDRHTVGAKPVRLIGPVQPGDIHIATLVGIGLAVVAIQLKVAIRASKHAYPGDLLGLIGAAH